MRCPSCKIEVVPWSGMTTLMGVEVSATGDGCTSCGEIFIGTRETKRIELDVAEQLAMKAERTEAEERFVRKIRSR